jgi:hypothetical protein
VPHRFKWKDVLNFSESEKINDLIDTNFEKNNNFSEGL